jgi:methyltransferase (TIGR00027 family)
MPRSDSDTWDLASSVGATATMVAAARALATKEPDPLINDPFAAPLVRAVGIDFFTRVIDGEITPTDTGEAGEVEVQTETDTLAVRTRFFDDFFTGATAAGIGQVVILAAGLDARAYRLAWPPGTVVYEVDQPEVIKFKTDTMAQLGAEPTAERRTVSIDFREDWPTALRRSGFDDTKPAAWSAEGLLMYLPPEAQDRLFDHVTALSAPGSQLATEYHPDTGPTMAERGRAMNDRWANLGCDLICRGCSTRASATTSRSTSGIGVGR